MVAGSSSDRSQYDSPEFRQIVPFGTRAAGSELCVHRRVAIDGLHDTAGEHLQRPVVAKPVKGVTRDPGIDGHADAERPVAKALLHRRQV
jgi:hypothetical protein